MKNNPPRFDAPVPHLLPHADIAARAKILWEQRGRPEGQDREIWLEAERQLGRSGSATSAAEERIYGRELLDQDGDPNDETDERLREIVSPPASRSATAL